MLAFFVPEKRSRINNTILLIIFMIDCFDSALGMAFPGLYGNKREE
jgi:hypothetical protein